MVSELFFIEKNQSQTKITNTKLLTFFPKETTVQKNEFGVPYLYQNNIKLPVVISTSHHGNYGAFVISEN
jgi:phosphopantetheinyl transferase